MTLDIISVNLWQILISLVNLLIIFLVVKKFLFKPVKNIMAKRQAEIDSQYESAESAVQSANADKAAWEQKMLSADKEAEEIIKSAAANAERRSEAMLADAKSKADIIVKHAEAEAELTHKKAEAQIRHEIAGVSVAISEKMLGREINEDDHRELIDSFIEKIGDDND